MPGVQKHRCTNISALQQPLKNFTWISCRNFVIKVMMVTTISETLLGSYMQVWKNCFY